MIKDITVKPCLKRYIHEHVDGSKTAYLHYIDGIEIWMYIPAWKGWKKVQEFAGEREVY